MTDSSTADFFISYTQADRAWAEWIAWILEAAGYITVIQAWDFRAGRNFVSDMNDAAKNAKCTIAVLSSDYLGSEFAEAEWTAAFARDPTGRKGFLLPIRVREFNDEGLLSTIVYTDLVGRDRTAARELVLLEAQGGRAKPSREPQFPGASAEPPYPGRTQRDWRTRGSSGTNTASPETSEKSHVTKTDASRVARHRNDGTTRNATGANHPSVIFADELQATSEGGQTRPVKGVLTSFLRRTLIIVLSKNEFRAIATLFVIAVLIAVVSKFGLSLLTMALGIAVTIFLAMLYVLFTWLGKTRAAQKSNVSSLLAFTVAFVFCASVLFAFASTFLNYPLPIRDYLVQKLGTQEVKQQLASTKVDQYVDEVIAKGRSIEQIVISETGTGVELSTTGLSEFLKERKYGYHFIVDRHGYYYPFADITEVVAHTTGHNRRSVGIGLTHKQGEEYPIKQIAGLERLLVNLLHRLSLGPEIVVSKETLDSRRQRDITEWIPQLQKSLALSANRESSFDFVLEIPFPDEHPTSLTVANHYALDLVVEEVSHKDDSRVSIAGHGSMSDVMESGELGMITHERAMGLGELRANAVKDYLAERGIPESRIDVVSYGRELPITKENTEQAWRQNRRVVITLN